MDDLERRYTRIEAKLNIVAKGVSFSLAGIAGVSAYFLTQGQEWRDWYVLAALGIAGAIVEVPMWSLEKRLPYDD